MRYLKENNFKVISLRELWEMLENSKPFLPKSVVLTFDDGYEDNYLNAFPILKKFNFPATIFVPTSFIGKEKEARKGARLRILNIEEIKEMAKSGLVEFGSHSHNYLKLTKLNDGELERELADSKKILEEILGFPVTSFAYPYGNFDERVKNRVSKYYNLAFSINKGVVNSKSDFFTLPRNSIDSKITMTQFKWIVKFGRL